MSKKLFEETLEECSKKKQKLVEELANEVINDLDDETIETLKTKPPYNHFGFGLYIRNNYIYTNKNKIIGDPDSLSAMIYAKILEIIDIKKED